MNQIEFFKQAQAYAVVGASADPSKFGNKVLRFYKQNTTNPIYPVNPKADSIEGIKVIKDLKDLPDPKHTSVSVITPPPVTLSVLKTAAELGIKNVWLQPGSENYEGIELAKKSGLNVIYDGPCVLVNGPGLINSK
ncbi:hypothetical protein HK103_000452 [Boothiomyces macroporosus]|uniref:CoA-binding domain-containing protein n=1 Tax=Boothiomyces macroporosus TaxID=261099 RepID=A0AAD5UCF7_9FUNG|nr:hypothetical protein HK103_000452 [Boothiomyces macroporosus]